MHEGILGILSRRGAHGNFYVHVHIIHETICLREEGQSEGEDKDKDECTDAYEFPF